MSDDRPEELFAPGGGEGTPYLVRPDKPAPPKRFYREARTELREGAHALLLDGRPARTPGRKPLAAPHAAVADIVVREWEAQREVVDPATMPMTRLLNSVIDGVSEARDAVVDEIARFAASDMLCYRASTPERLLLRQAELWDPVLDWAHERLGARFILVEGVMFAEQPAGSIEAVRRAIEAQASPFVIGGLHVLTSLAGSVLIALALADGRLDVAQAWRAAHVDEDVQAEIWGVDAEAQARRDARFTEFEAAAALVAHLWAR